MAELLRAKHNADGDPVEIKVAFDGSAGLPRNVLPRLIQIAAALKDAPKTGVARLVTKVETDFAAGQVLVTAMLTHASSAEQAQRDLLDLMPPA